MTNINIEKFNSDYKKLLKQERLDMLPEEIRTQVVTALEYEEDEEYVKAEMICRDILDKHKDEDINLEQVRILLARIYPKILNNDVEFGNHRYKKDEESYFALLDELNMNVLMKDYLVDTIMNLGRLMANKWYRPLFEEFLNHIEEKGYLKEENYHCTIESAYCSLESYGYFEDAKISMVIKNLLKACYQRAFAMEDENAEGLRNSMMIDALTNEWYACRYYAGHQEEFMYVEKEYPHSYALIDSGIRDKDYDKEAKAEEILEELMKYVADGITRDKLEDTMNCAYTDMIEKFSKTSGKPVVVHSGEEPYRNNEMKIGRNDLCPCGSGKKYKYCCGR